MLAPGGVDLRISSQVIVLDRYRKAGAWSLVTRAWFKGWRNIFWMGINTDHEKTQARIPCTSIPALNQRKTKPSTILAIAANRERIGPYINAYASQRRRHLRSIPRVPSDSLPSGMGRSMSAGRFQQIVGEER